MSDLDEVMRWEPAQVAEWVGQQGFAEFADAFIGTPSCGVGSAYLLTDRIYFLR